MFENLQGSSLDRRSFLRGSVMFAAAIGVSVLPAFAQEQAPQKPKPEEGEKKKEEPKDPFDTGKKEEDKDKSYHVSERSYGVFYRMLQLPHGVDPKTVQATMSNGVLKITIPKPAGTQPTKIEIKEAA